MRISSRLLCDHVERESETRSYSAACWFKWSRYYLMVDWMFRHISSEIKSWSSYKMSTDKWIQVILLFSSTLNTSHEWLPESSLRLNSRSYLLYFLANRQSHWIETEQSSLELKKLRLVLAIFLEFERKTIAQFDCSADPEISLVFRFRAFILRSSSTNKSLSIFHDHPSVSIITSSKADFSFVIFSFALNDALNDHIIKYCLTFFLTVFSYSPWHVTASKTMDTSSSSQPHEASL